MKFRADVRGSQRMNPSDFDDPPTFPPVRSAGQGFHRFCEISQRPLDGSTRNLVQTFVIPR